MIQEVTVFHWIGRQTLLLATVTGRYAQFSGRITVWALRPPFEWREFMRQCETVGVKSLPVVSVTAIFTGMVFALQTFEGFRRFQAEAWVPGVLGLALLRELVPVLGGFMVAGRVGSAMAAELGTMRVTDQIDALEVMATSPIQYLVVPRVLSLTLMLPLLIAVGDLLGLLGGWYLVSEVLHSPTPGFMDRVFEFMDLKDFTSGMAKSAVFGLLIALIGCFEGLYARGGAEGVGRATTAAVVQASLSIVVVDFFLTKLLF